MKKRLLSLLTITCTLAIQAQIVLTKEINNSGALNSSPSSLFTFNNKIYFAADDSSGSNTGGTDYGKELWISDGTESGTVLVKDLRTGTSNSTPSFFFNYNNTLYFSANPGSGNVLFTTDGTENGTTEVGAPFIFNQVEVNGLIYFVLTTDSNKLYAFNGTTAASVTNLGTGTESILGATIVGYNGKIICYMDYSEDEPTLGRELYAYDPTTNVFSLIKDITGDANDAGISNFTVVNGILYFEALDALWKTDGTTNGTITVATASSLSGLNNFFEWNGNLYFEGDNGTSGDQLWAYNPTADTVTNISNITGGTSNDHNPSDYAALDGYLYYAGQVADNISQYLFRTNGVTSERVDSNIIDIDDLTVLNGKLYFEGDNGTTGNELYSFDPTTLSTNKNSVEIVSVFPNPATNYIMVSKNLINKPYAIYETSGKLVQNGIISSETLNLNLSSGLYLFKITSENNTLTKKILIK